MITVVCPQCQNKIDLIMPLELGQRVTCSWCNTPLEIIWLYPLSLDTIEWKAGNTKMISKEEDVSKQAKLDKSTHT